MKKFNPQKNTMYPRTKDQTALRGPSAASVQLKFSNPQHKREMLDICLKLIKMYKGDPVLFTDVCGTGKQPKLGNDHKQYTIAQIFRDYEKQYDKWANNLNNHIFESFIIRHNYIVHKIADALYAHPKGGIGEAANAVKDLWIDYDPGNPPPYQTTTNALFDIT